MKIHIDGAIIVEGKYDKIHLSTLVDCPIIATNGFEIFKDENTKRLIRFYADNGGIIILTDSDSAGFKIRSHIKSFIPGEKIKNAYIPDIYGKEKRKLSPSKEGKLGVEGIPVEIIKNVLMQAGVSSNTDNAPKKPITRQDLFDDGFTGGKDSSSKRQRMLKILNLPERLTTNGMLDAMNKILSYDEYKSLVNKLNMQTQDK